MGRYFLRIFILLGSVICFFCPRATAQNTVDNPVNIIFDSDMGPDYDDVGAITILHALADQGEAKILATIASTKYEGVAAVMDVFNTYFNRPDLPIGVPTGKALELRDWQHWSDTLIAKYPHKIKSNHEAMDAVELYRKILSAQSDHSLTIVTVGFLTNLSGLLNSKADKYSKLDGLELVRSKVKQLVSMAGAYPQGDEFNINRDPASARYVFEHWPSQVIFSGFEIGKDIKTGIPLKNNNSINNSPVKDVFRISIPMAAEDAQGRKSWDETAVLVAIKGFDKYYSLHYGKIKVADNGKNTWDDTGTGQAYLVAKVSAESVQKLINDLIMYQPLEVKAER
jgi:inosine-uridine nucleoside N-ribohydrolase